jgi:hypothetical protein
MKKNKKNRVCRVCGISLAKDNGIYPVCALCTESLEMQQLKYGEEKNENKS